MMFILLFRFFSLKMKKKTAALQFVLQFILFPFAIFTFVFSRLYCIERMHRLHKFVDILRNVCFTVVRSFVCSFVLYLSLSLLFLRVFFYCCNSVSHLNIFTEIVFKSRVLMLLWCCFCCLSYFYAFFMLFYHFHCTLFFVYFRSWLHLNRFSFSFLLKFNDCFFPVFSLILSFYFYLFYRTKNEYNTYTRLLAMDSVYFS